MTGILQQEKEKRELISVGGKIYNVHVTYYNVQSTDGYVVGLKFSDQFNSMDSAKRGSTNPFLLATAVASAAIRMITPDLDTISVFGFYLLTEDLETRRKGGSHFKTLIYQAKAIEMHEVVKHRLPYLTQLEANGGVGWAMGKEDFENPHHFQFFEQELQKRLRIIPC